MLLKGKFLPKEVNYTNKTTPPPTTRTPTTTKQEMNNLTPSKPKERKYIYIHYYHHHHHNHHQSNNNKITGINNHCSWISLNINTPIKACILNWHISLCIYYINVVGWKAKQKCGIKNVNLSNAITDPIDHIKNTVILLWRSW